jgi:hypothetical protein
MPVVRGSGSERRAIQEAIAWLSGRKFNLAFEGIDLPPPSEHALFFSGKIHFVVTPVVFELWRED